MIMLRPSATWQISELHLQISEQLVSPMMVAQDDDGLSPALRIFVLSI